MEVLGRTLPVSSSPWVLASLAQIFLGQDPSCLFKPLGPGFLSSPHPSRLCLLARPSRFMSEFQISLLFQTQKACWI